MSKSFYVNVSSKSSLYTTNTASTFRVNVKLPNLDGYSCSLEEIQLPRVTGIKVAHVWCNFISPQYINEARRPVLRTLYSPKKHLTLSSQYKTVDTTDIHVLEFHIEDEKHEPIEFPSGTVTRLTLHFRHGLC